MSRAAAGIRLLAAAVLVATLASGCTAIRLAYDNADAWIRWRASDYFDVSGADSEELDQRIDAFHAWHRAQALPQYARVAEETARRLAGGLSRGDINWAYDTATRQARESLVAAAERIAPFLDRVGASQLEALQRGFAEDNRKYAREYLRGGEAERRARRAKRTTERLEDWVGRLTPAQIQRVREYSERAPLHDELRFRDRQRLQGEFLGIVRARAAQARLPGWVADLTRGRDPAYQAAVDAIRDQYYALLVDIDRTLSAEQRARAVVRMRGFAEDFTLLASRGREPKSP